MSERASIPLSTRPPLRDLWRHARTHRRKVVLATFFSVLNKICDVAPELLIGAAVDVVARDGESFVGRLFGVEDRFRSEEHTSELQSLMRISYAVFCLQKKKTQ